MNTEKKGNQAVINNTKDKTNHIGLWVSLSVAATAALGVLAIAFYMDYQENKTKISTPVSAINTSSAPSAIPTSEAQAASIAAATSDRQVQGMTAPSDDGNNDSDKTPASSTTATASQTAAASQAAVTVEKQAASNPAKTILETETTVNAENQVVAPSNTTVNFYFAIGKADLAANTLESLKDLVAGVKNGKKAVIISHADAEANATLTKERAFAVRSVLLAAGVPENSIEVKEPTTGKSNSRLVQVILQ